MTQDIHTAVESQLYDLFDNTKYELSELNQSKSLVLNGPDNKLIKRGLDISYLQGQKKAIDAIDTILKNNHDDTSFITNFNTYTLSILDNYNRSFTNFKNIGYPPADYDVILAHHYTLMGQKSVVDAVNSTVTQS
ncbi:hypothetical protein [Staphylococcus caeli]|uniref:hypothetical protein n=1 Tax=Staphylococcus caeli TaxID=2201815 RepID=UPI003F557393